MTDTQEEFPVMDSPNGHHFMHSHSMITTRHFSPILLLNIYGKITINKQEQMTTMVTEKHIMQISKDIVIFFISI